MAAVLAVAAITVAAFIARVAGVRDRSSGAREGVIVLRTLVDFDLDSPSTGGWSEPQSAHADRVSFVRSVDGTSPRRGATAARFEVQPRDSNVAGSGEGERAEVFLTETRTMGSEASQWWAWSTYFPPEFETANGAWNVFTQFHHSGSAGQSNIHFDIREREALGLRVMGGSFDAPEREDFILGRLERGKWYDFVFHVRWSASQTGFVEVWMNEKLVVPLTRTPTLYEGQGVYLKQGYYRSPYERATVVFHDGTRRLVPLAGASEAGQEGTETVAR